MTPSQFAGSKLALSLRLVVAGRLASAEPDRLTVPTILALAIMLNLASSMIAGIALAQDETGVDLDDLMGGFEDDFEPLEAEQPVDETPSWLAGLPFGEWIHEQVDLSGSIAAGTVYSYRDHKVPHGDELGETTSYNNVTRLDIDGFLQLDVQLPHDWQIRAEAMGWYDFIYRIKGRDQYGGEVLDVYEWQVDTGEVYLTGPLHRKLDLTIGSKIVNWGRSDTFRVVDVINPLDNKEPGLVDIEDLRRPKAMLKLDATSGPWSAQFLVIPENRYDRNPPCGSDYFPDKTNPAIGCVSVQRHGRSDFSGMPALAGKIDGRFSGWDFSLYGAYTDESSRVIDFSGGRLRGEANRIGLLGTGGNWTRGAWLVKAELAWLTEIQVFRLNNGIPLPSDPEDRIDSMLGVEYYGRDSLTIVLEVVNRHLLNKPKGQSSDLLTSRSRIESSIRISRPFFRERLNLTALAVGFGERLQDGGIVRFLGDYELTDAWKAEAGIIFYIGGSEPGLGAWDKNDRLYAEIKYSF